jgi:DNA-3-methyladenine glycosylase
VFASFDTDAQTLARRLLGCVLVRRVERGLVLRGRIVETEAYVGVQDRASHAFGGRRTPRNESMYARAGTAYIYFTYGMHHCFNVVCGAIDEPAAVLIRAVEPLGDLQLWRAHRRADDPSRKSPLKDRDLARGPGRLCEAMRLDRTLDGEDLTASQRVWIEPADTDRKPAHARSPRSETSIAIGPGIADGPRIGIGDKGPWTRAPLRFWLEGSPWVS